MKNSPSSVSEYVLSSDSIFVSCFTFTATLRASPLDAFFTVALPLAKPGFITAAILSFAHTLGEFGVVLMIGGNLPGVTRTVSVSIYDQVQSLDYATANRTSLLLLLFSFAVLSITYSLQRKFVQVWMTR